MSAMFVSAEFKLLSEYICEKYGLVFEGPRQEILLSRLSARLKATQCDNFYEYYRFLKLHPTSSQEHIELEQTLTNNETYFFRERHQMDLLAKQVSEKTKISGQQKILSIGCSSGEEVYSLSMLLPQGRVEIVGVDLHYSKVQQACSGIYTLRSIRGCVLPDIERFFSHVDQSYVVKDAYRKKTSFQVRNVMDVQWAQELGPVDVVFCRNMLIYFDEKAFMKTIENIHKVLKPDGLLFLGHSESLIGRTHLFKAEMLSNTVFYKKVNL